jgi:hypothetical protein
MAGGSVFSEALAEAEAGAGAALQEVACIASTPEEAAHVFGRLAAASVAFRAEGAARGESGGEGEGEWEGDVALAAAKVTGDAHVPAGQTSFVARLPPPSGEDALAAARGIAGGPGAAGCARPPATESALPWRWPRGRDTCLRIVRPLVNANKPGDGDTGDAGTPFARQVGRGGGGRAWGAAGRRRGLPPPAPPALRPAAARGRGRSPPTTPAGPHPDPSTWPSPGPPIVPNAYQRS